MHVAETGALITALKSVESIYHYCSKLPRDKYCTLVPVFNFTTLKKNCEYICELRMPCNAAVRYVKGDIRDSKKRAKRNVCLKACHILYERKALDDKLLPVYNLPETLLDIIEAADIELVADRVNSYDYYCPRGLSGKWKWEEEVQTLHLYMFDYGLDRDGSCNGGYGFITSAETYYKELMPFAVFPRKCQIDHQAFPPSPNIAVRYVGQVKVTCAQFKTAWKFHSLLCNLLIRPNENLLLPQSLEQKDPLFIPWESSEKMYLIVPIIRQSTPWRATIDWETSLKAIERAQCGIRIYVDANNGDDDRVLYWLKTAESSPPLQITEPLVLLNELSPFKFYLFDRVRGDLSPLSPLGFSMRTTGQTEEDKVHTFFDYYSAKYSIPLNTSQAMLQAQFLPKPKNLLKRNMINKNNQDVESSDASSRNEKVDKRKQDNTVFLPSELCLVHPVSGQMLKQSFHLPSFLWRVEPLFLVEELVEAMVLERSVILLYKINQQCLAKAFRHRALKA